MREALVFNPKSVLDYHDIRANVARIPEVVGRLREAQSIWDTISPKSLDWVNFLAADDTAFLSHIRLKNLISAVVQVGLVDRFLKLYPLPEFVVGAVNGDSALQVSLGLLSFFDLLAESPAAGLSTLPASPSKGMPKAANVPCGLPVLAGVQIVEFGIYQRTGQGEYQRLAVESRDLGAMLLDLVDQHKVGRVISVGPGISNCTTARANLKAHEVTVVESITLDARLSWFWGNLKDTRLAIAN
jgi:hypothetical protein